MGGELGMDRDDDVFSTAESAYFSSYGANVSPELDKPAEAEPKPEEKPAAEAADPAKVADPKDRDIDPKEPDEISVEEGQARDKKTGRYVPVQALREARGEAKTLKGEREELRTTNAKLMGILERISAGAEARQQKPAAAKEEPKPEELIDPDVDPIGAVKQERRLREKAEKDAAERERKLGEQVTETQRQGVVRSDIGAHRAKVGAEDFDAAMSHLTTVLERQRGRLNAFRGEDGKPDAGKIKRAVMDDLNGVINDAIAHGQSAGKALYDWAVEEFGYQAKGGKPVQQQQQVDPVKAAAEAAAAAAGGGKTPAEQALDAVGAGADGARTLSNVGGGVNSPNGLTQEALLAMDDDALEELGSKLIANPELKAQIDRALGKR
jgi:hypothetical protein